MGCNGMEVERFQGSCDPRMVSPALEGIYRAIARQRCWARVHELAPEDRLAVVLDGDPFICAWLLKHNFRVVVEASERAAAITNVVDSELLTVVRRAAYSDEQQAGELEEAVNSARAQGAVSCFVFSHVHVMDLSSTKLVHALVDRVAALVDPKGAAVFHYPRGGGSAGATREMVLPPEIVAHLLQQKGFRLNHSGFSGQNLEAYEFVETLVHRENVYREKFHAILVSLFGAELMADDTVQAQLYGLCERGPLESLLFDFRKP